MKFSIISVQKFSNCDKDGNPVYTNQSISVIQGTEQQEINKFAELAKIAAQECKDCDCIATVPEWWQLRPEAQRPQGILLFRELRDDGTIGNDRYSITIPHCTLTTPPSNPPLVEYKKGDFEGILTLKDNSKLIVNCETAIECNRVIDKLSQVIDNDYLEGSSRKIGKRSGLPFKQIKVVASGAHYYPNGVKSMKPIYIKSFR